MDAYLKSFTDFGQFAVQASLTIGTIMGAALFAAFILSSGINRIRRYWWEVKSWQPPKDDTPKQNDSR